MTIRKRFAAIALAALFVSCLAVITSGVSAQAAALGGGSLVYSKAGNIHLARADGSNDIVFAKGGWYWPSMDDHGVIAAERQDRAAPDGTTGYTIHRFRQNGRQLSRLNTPSALSSSSCQAQPSYHVSLSPDGTKVGYDWMDCTGVFATWTPATKFTLHTHMDYFAPSWLSNTAMTISHFGVTFSASQAEVGVLRTSGGGTGWSGDLADSWATAYHATATRNGRKIALIEDDAANYFDGTPRHVRLVFGTSSGPGHTITRRCSLTLPAAQYKAWRGATYSNLSFRPDGNILAFDSATGIYKVNTRSLTGCTATSLSKKLWIKGGANPSFSPAADTRS